MSPNIKFALRQSFVFSNLFSTHLHDYGFFVSQMLRLLRPAPLITTPSGQVTAVLLMASAIFAHAQFTPVQQMEGGMDPGLRQVGQANYTMPIHGSDSFEVLPQYGSGESMANRLRQAPAQLFSFDRASLRDVLRFLAENAGVPFVSLLERAGSGAEGSSLDNVLVTFTMRAAPFTVLEAIADANDIALVFQNGIWIIRPINERELIGRIYKLRFTPQEKVTFDAAAGGGSGAAVTTSGTGASASIPNLSRQQSQNIFKVEEPALVQEIKNMLRIQSRSPNAVLAQGEASVENFPALPQNTGLRPGWAAQSGEAESSEPSVTFNSDTNSIYIVATRQQHKWVEGFLSAADQPQALIGIEVKFFETTKDPQKDLGVNWAGTMQDGFTVGLREIRAAPAGDIQVSQTRDRESLSGQLEPGQSPYDRIERTNRMNANFAAPYSAVLTTSDVAFTIEAFMQDRETSIVQYPRVLTVNNREVAISNAINTPILGSSQQSQTGGSTQTNNTIEYLPIGTQLNILPKTMPDGSVFLSLAITISSFLTDVEINAGGVNNRYPVTSSRVYQAALQVDPGFTLAVGGLEEANDGLDRNGIPLLQDIPGLGYLFKSQGRRQRKRNLIIFITPTVIYNRTETSGITDIPITTLPIRPGSVPRAPAFTPDGQLVGAVDAVSEAIRWLEYQLDYYSELDRESRVDRKTIEALRGIIRTALMIQAQLPLIAQMRPEQAAFLGNAEQTIENIVSAMNRTLSSSRQKIISY
jgi:hypothetical protein